MGIAASREVKEETGIDAKPLGLVTLRHTHPHPELSFPCKSIKTENCIKGVPGNMVNSDQNTPNFEFILIRLFRSSWREPFSLKPRGSGFTAWSIKIR